MARSRWNHPPVSLHSNILVYTTSLLFELLPTARVQRHSAKEDDFEVAASTFEMRCRPQFATSLESTAGTICRCPLGLSRPTLHRISIHRR